MSTSNDRVGIIAGASGGLGSAVATLLAKRGDRLLLLGRTEANLRGVLDGIRNRAPQAEVLHSLLDFHCADLEVYRTAVGRAWHRFGRIDYVINCAGVASWWPLTEMALEVWEAVLATNLHGPMLLSKCVAPLLIESGGGTLVHVASPAGKKGSAYSTAYCAAKAGLIGFCNALAVELAPKGVRVVAFTPGAIRTEFVSRALAASADGVRAVVARKFDASGGVDPEEIAAEIISSFCNRLRL